MDEEGKTETFDDVLPDERQLPEVQTVDTKETTEEYCQPHPPSRKKRDTLPRENPFNQAVRESWPASKVDEIQLDIDTGKLLQPVIALGFDDIFVQPEPLK
ncbi:DgyrCDS13206 [Dimorphilus gyrociliatus]|uniref:DgyrCDS13206 n=1 Tax=Dimorphilus gyrociliatus TaxID=2664684 RepID=A0A7I8W9Z6_9ANNE|nr:DgyrCDS13206 [Dimorphilus gyrociliatus]